MPAVQRTEEKQSEFMGCLEADKNRLLKTMDGLMHSPIPANMRWQMLATAHARFGELSALMAEFDTARKQGAPSEQFITDYAERCGDWAAKAAQFYTQYEAATTLYRKIDEGKANYERLYRPLDQSLPTIVGNKVRDRLAVFERANADLSMVQLYSLPDLFNADGSVTKKYLDAFAKATALGTLDGNTFTTVAWDAYSSSYLSQDSARFAKALEGATEAVKAEQKAMLSAAAVVRRNGKVVYRNNAPVEEPLLSEEARKGLSKDYYGVTRLLVDAQYALKTEKNAAKAADLLKQAQDAIGDVRQQTRKLMAEAAMEKSGREMSGWTEIAGDAAVLALGVAGSFAGPAPAAASAAYFAAKGASYVYLGVITDNPELVFSGTMMLLPTALGTASKGMLQLTRMGAVTVETGATSAYALMLSERAIGAYFSASMIYGAGDAFVEGQKYGFDSERIKTITQNAVFAGFGLAVAAGKRLSDIRVRRTETIFEPIKAEKTKPSETPGLKLGPEYTGMPAEFRNPKIDAVTGRRTVKIIGEIDTETGSSAGVFLGELPDGTRVAVKVYRNAFDSDWKHSAKYFEGEIAGAKILSDLGLGPKYYGITDVNGNLAYIMELVRGKAPEDMTVAELNRYVTKDTYRQVQEGYDRLVKSGYDIGDVQYAVATEPQTLNGRRIKPGDVIFWDAGGLMPLQKNGPLWGGGRISKEMRDGIDVTRWLSYFDDATFKNPENAGFLGLVLEKYNNMPGRRKWKVDTETLRRFLVDFKSPAERVEYIEHHIALEAKHGEGLGYASQLFDAVRRIEAESGVQLLTPGIEFSDIVAKRIRYSKLKAAQ